MDFHSLTRRELQTLCKSNKIPANMTNIAMADALKALDIVEGLDDFMNRSPEKTVMESPSCRTSTRKKTIKDEPQSSQTLIRTRCRARRIGGDVDQEKNDVPATPVVPISRKRVLAGSTRRKVETHLREDKEEDEKIGESVVRRVYSTRRSVRLSEKKPPESDLKEGARREPIKIDTLDKEMPKDLPRSDDSVRVSEDKGSDLQDISEVGPERTDESEVISGRERSVESEVGCERSDESCEISEKAVDLTDETLEKKGPDDVLVTVFLSDTENFNEVLTSENGQAESVVGDSSGDSEKSELDVLNENDASSDQDQNLEECQNLVSKFSDTSLTEDQNGRVAGDDEAESYAIQDLETRFATEEESNSATDVFSGKILVDNEHSGKADAGESKILVAADFPGQESMNFDNFMGPCLAKNPAAEMEKHKSDVAEGPVMETHECPPSLNLTPASVKPISPRCSLISGNNVIDQLHIQVAVDSTDQESINFDNVMAPCSAKVPMPNTEKYSSELWIDVCGVAEVPAMTTNECHPSLNKTPTSVKQMSPRSLVSNSEVMGKIPFSILAADLLPAQVPSSLCQMTEVGGSDSHPTHLTPRKSSRKTPTTIRRITHVSDDKENIDSGRKMEPKKGKGQNKDNTAEDIMLNDKSLTQLRKMFREKLQINNNRNNDEENNVAKVARVRPALQTLPENRLAAGEPEKEN